MIASPLRSSQYASGSTVSEQNAHAQYPPGYVGMFEVYVAQIGNTFLRRLYIFLISSLFTKGDSYCAAIIPPDLSERFTFV